MTRIFLRAAVTIAFQAVPLAAQTTWYVDLTNPPPGSGTLEDPYTSIQYAIDQPTTLAGDTVDVLPGTYFESVNFHGKSLLLVSARGPGLTILDGRGIAPVVRIESGEGSQTRVAGFTIQNGRGVKFDVLGLYGGGVRVIGSQAQVESCILRDNFAYLGAGFYADGAVLRVSGCIVEANPCGGGVFALNSAVELFDTTIRGQRDVSCPGWGNFGTSALRAEACTITVERCVIEQDMDYSGFNFSASGLGLIECVSTVLDSTFADNGNQHYVIDQGGAILVRGGSLAVSGTAFTNNRNEFRGGAIAVYGATLDVDKCSFLENDSSDAYWGGAIYVDDSLGSHLTVSNSEFVGGYSGGGTALWIGSGTATISHCSIRRNIASTSYYEEGAGAGIWVEGASASIDACVFEDNAARGGPDLPGKGGAIYVRPAGNAAIRHSIFTGNVCIGWYSYYDGPTRGGAICGPAYVENCTLHGNVARAVDEIPGEGGGAYGATLDSCVVWHNLPDAIAGNALADWSDIEGGWSGRGIIDLDPLLWDPAHGDMRLPPGSPCIDTGNPARYDDDGTRVDMGAQPYDAGFCGGPFAYCWANESSEGCTPSIGWTGTATVGGPDDFHVTASSLPAHRFGMLLWSTVDRELPFFDGVLCVGPPIWRTAVQNSGSPASCEGRFDFHFSHPYMHGSGLRAGDVVFAQYWYRDPGSASGAGLTDALKFMLCASSDL